MVKWRTQRDAIEVVLAGSHATDAVQTDADGGGRGPPVNAQNVLVRVSFVVPHGNR
jgi:hypothetical protein